LAHTFQGMQLGVSCTFEGCLGPSFWASIEKRLCSKFEVSPKVLSGLFGLVNRASSLSAARGGEGNGPATDVADHRADELTQAVEAAERRALIEQLMKSLSPRE